MGGGVFKKEGERAIEETATVSHTSLTQDIADSGAAACACREHRTYSRAPIWAPENDRWDSTCQQEERDSTRALIQMKSRAAQSESMLLMRKRQLIGRQLVPTISPTWSRGGCSMYVYPEV